MKRRSIIKFIGTLGGCLPFSYVTTARGQERGSISAKEKMYPAVTILPEKWAFGKRTPCREIPARLQQIHHKSLLSLTANFAYYGGSSPGETRVVIPHELYTVEGYPDIYLTAYCHHRKAIRTFNTELINQAPKRHEPTESLSDETGFICPECGSRKYSGFANISTHPQQGKPWSYVLSTKTCAKCGHEIPDHLGHRWDGITLTEAREEWRKDYRKKYIRI